MSKIEIIDGNKEYVKNKEKIKILENINYLYFTHIISSLFLRF